MNNNGLEYSTDAINVKSLFYNKKIFVYVEGDEDKLFWDFEFKKITNDVHFEDVGGKPNLERYMNKICNENASIIVALDRDYSLYVETEHQHPQIISTYGYSIENSMYCPYKINGTVKGHARSTDDFIDEIENWFDRFYSNCSPLLVYDVTNVAKRINIACLGDRCNPYLKGRHLSEIDPIKINNHIDKIKDSFSQGDLAHYQGIIDRDDRLSRYKIRGHFLTNGVINLIKKIVVTNRGVCPTLSKDNLYAIMIPCHAQCGNECSDKKWLKTKIRSAVDAID